MHFWYVLCFGWQQFLRGWRRKAKWRGQRRSCGANRPPHTVLLCSNPVNPIQGPNQRWADYAYHITICPPDFQTFLHASHIQYKCQ